MSVHPSDCDCFLCLPLPPQCCKCGRILSEEENISDGLFYERCEDCKDDDKYEEK